ncbi:MAG: TetR/AcrR family transcriptional regulator [Mycolicibacterium fortuitum]|uniref:TetR/AcrR family transcriptional regulator n=1 Tax=Mycolicibacterium fortuitum TaxID=1766 RepID=UPI0022BA70B6|nr:TetR/AcrR family transcriptional regulator [Mycolicibacterium fortuitum]WAY19779.1 TetR/AcrR family transcriptional regulator [Mycolicibacterium fortuitum]
MLDSSVRVERANVIVLSSKSVDEPGSSDRADATVARILDGAYAAAQVHGLRKLTMDEIAKYTGLARVTLYKYFPNKDALVSALVTRELGDLLDEISRVGAPYADVGMRLTAMFTTAHELLRNNGLLQRLLATEPETILPIIAYDSPFLTIGRAWIESELVELHAAGSPEDLSRAAEHIVRVMQSLLLAPPSVFDLNDPDDVRQLVSAWILPTLPATE